jgi:hypothetical protein
VWENSTCGAAATTTAIHHAIELEVLWVIIKVVKVMHHLWLLLLGVHTVVRRIILGCSPGRHHHLLLLLLILLLLLLLLLLLHNAWRVVSHVMVHQHRSRHL